MRKQNGQLASRAASSRAASSFPFCFRILRAFAHEQDTITQDGQIKLGEMFHGAQDAEAKREA
jgi:hypothetical protein